MGIAHFTNIQTAHELIEPIYKSLAEVEFYEYHHFGMKCIKYPILTDQLIKISGNLMFFNFNYDSLTKETNPLKTINDFMKKGTSRLLVSVSFHDKQGLVIYKSELSGFKFTKIVNDLDFGWNDNGIKELIVEFDYKKKVIETL